ncbi:MAG: hypothetical protein KAG99_01385 [Bacteroidales bacterium]|nr:hypothetical protein [Bacteroidales bacterium]
MSLSKDKIRGIVGTVIIHGLLLATIMLLALTTPLPLPGEEGVEVDLGYSDVGSGIVQEEETEPVQQAEVTPPLTKPEATEEEVVTQDIEETPMIEEIDKQKEEKEIIDETVVQNQPVEEIEQEPEQEPEPVVNPNALYKGRDTGEPNGSNEGVTGDAGDQGKPTGTRDLKVYDGLGGEGDGISYSLSGRQATRLPKPEYRSEEQGKVVVTIWVNRNGDVTRAEAGARGTTIADLTLRRLARGAALRAKFSPDTHAAEIQKGSITYIFIKMN